MKNIRLYELESEYLSDKDNLEYPTVSYTKDTDVVHYIEQATSPFEFVDLGLSVKWATCNVGASAPEEYGLYFQWGETQGSNEASDEQEFTWEGYKFTTDGGSTFTKYNTTDMLVTLEAEDDAVTVLDSSARMPTMEECEELIANTTTAWTTVNDVDGVRFSSANGESIFFPAAGAFLESDAGEFGGWWSSSIDSEWDVRGDAYMLSIISENLGLVSLSRQGRSLGLPIRAVKP